MKQIKLLLIFSLILFATWAFSQDIYYSQDAGGWSSCGTWYTETGWCDPGGGDNAIITDFNPVYCGYNESCLNLYIEEEGGLYSAYNYSVGGLKVYGGLINYGHISDYPGVSSGKLTIDVYDGGIQNYGYFGNSQLKLWGETFITSTKPFNCESINKYSVGDLVYNSTKLELNGTVLNFYEPASLIFNTTENDTMICNGSIDDFIHANVIHADTLTFIVNGSYEIGWTTFIMDLLDLYGSINVENVTFKTDMVINDSIQNPPDGWGNVEIHGNVHNKGKVLSPTNYFNITLYGNIINEGIWANTLTSLEDTLDQTIELVNGTAIDGQVQFVVPSGNSDYRWYKDGVLLLGDFRLSGTYTNTLVFNVPVTTEMAGRYYCVTEDGISRRIFVNISEPGKQLDLKVMLEGPFSGTEMTTDVNGLLPLSPPYASEPWKYSGPDSVTSIPNGDITDWIMVELRDAANVEAATEETTIAKIPAFLLKDGSVVGLDGISLLDFRGSVSLQLFAVIHHRNHLPVISANPLIESGGFYSYDFTSAASQSYLGDHSMKELSSGIWGMIAADFNADGHTNNPDKDDIWITENGLSGYLMGDANLDGVVDASDFNIWHINAGFSSQRPQLPGEYFTDPRDGEVYRTVQIGDQVWMAENLRYNSQYSRCFKDIPEMCDIAGKIYMYNGYNVCPEGWIYPTADDWKILQGSMDSQYGTEDSEWDQIDQWVGYDAGLNGKSETRWNGMDSFGFNAHPYGYYHNGWVNLGSRTGYWESWDNYHLFDTSVDNIYYGDHKVQNTDGYYVRCVKDQAE